MSVQLSFGARVRKSPFFEASVESGLRPPVFTITCTCQQAMAIQMLSTTD